MFRRRLRLTPSAVVVGLALAAAAPAAGAQTQPAPTLRVFAAAPSTTVLKYSRRVALDLGVYVRRSAATSSSG